jgi:hypothetical protein
MLVFYSMTPNDTVGASVVMLVTMKAYYFAYHASLGCRLSRVNHQGTCADKLAQYNLESAPCWPPLCARSSQIMCGEGKKDLDAACLSDDRGMDRVPTSGAQNRPRSDAEIQRKTSRPSRTEPRI